METCTYKDKTCSKTVNKYNHDGTLLKFEAFTDYVESWINKIFYHSQENKGKYNELIFVDCMCSSGLYYKYFKKDEYNYDADLFREGTGYKVIDKFRNYAEKFPEFNFTIYMNDYDEKFIKCMYCNERRLNTSDVKNLKIIYSNEDKYKFIDRITSLKEINNNKAHKLIIYDPYEVDFNWIYMKKLLKLNDSDLIITHFYPNDVKRIVNLENLNQDKKDVITYSYGIPFDQIKEYFYSHQTPSVRTEYFRELFNKKVKDHCYKKMSYAPVFNNKERNHVFDIVCISSSGIAIALLKDTMYRLYENSKQERKQYAQDSWNLFGDEQSYVDLRCDFNEYQLHYDDLTLTEIFKRTFAGKTLSKNEFEKVLQEHEYLPTNIKKQVKKIYKYKKMGDLYIFPKD
ncbi:MAG: hypothetical protein RR700_06150 [Anaerorhabdus sp.]|uniref:hypothetical protein n=1 Tax=Anaerorhabdus sp. TaxID=1872524 RepID=UPI002FC96D11